MCGAARQYLPNSGSVPGRNSASPARALATFPANRSAFPGKADAHAADWLAEFTRWQVESGKKLVRNLLAELLPKKLAGHLTSDLGEVVAAAFGAAARRELGYAPRGFTPEAGMFGGDVPG